MASVRHLGLFPFACVEQAPVLSPEIPDLYQPMSLEQLMALFWIVKVWRASVTSGGVPPFTGQANLSRLQYTINKETDLICVGADNPFVFTSYDPVWGGGSFTLGGIVDGESGTIKRTGAIYYPVFSAGASDFDIYTAGLYSLPLTGTTTLDLGAFGTLEWGAYGGTSPVTIEIKAIEFWPYDPNDGLGPIYNSATGAQIRTFPA